MDRDSANGSTPDFSVIEGMGEDEQHRLAETVTRLTMGEDVAPERVVHVPGSDYFAVSADQVNQALVDRDSGIEESTAVETPNDSLMTRRLAKKRLTEEFPDADTPSGLLTPSSHNEALLRMGMEQGGYKDAMEFVDDMDRAGTEFERIDDRSPDDDPFELADRRALVERGDEGERIDDRSSDDDPSGQGDESKSEGVLSSLRERFRSVTESLGPGGHHH